MPEVTSRTPVPTRSLAWTCIHIVLLLRDVVVKGTNRFVVRPYRRAKKQVRERSKNLMAGVRVQSAKQWRRARAVPRRAERRIHVWGDTVKGFRTYGTEWGIEREVGRVVSGNDPILVGPWLSEVGYEVLYWVPFVRWVQSHYGIKPSRLTVVTRGGAACWYRDITEQSVEVFDLLSAEAFAQGNAQRAIETGGSLKQWAPTSFDRTLVEAAAGKAGLENVRVLHPSLMYRLFEQFMLGHRHNDFLRRRTMYRQIEAPPVAIPALPDDFVAVKFYTAASLPDSPAMRRTLQSLVLALAERSPVVMLDTGLSVDDHDDYTFEHAARIVSIREHLTPRNNLAVQTAVIGRARAFVGTCGSLAWLAPMLGVDTTALLADPRFLHGHLQVARVVYQSIRGGRFSPLDMSGLDPLGLTITAVPDRVRADEGTA